MSLTNFIKNLLFPQRRGLSQKQVKSFKKRWQKIERKIDEGGESNYRVAVIDCDKMIQDVLNDLGYSDDTWANTLAQAKSKFSNSAFQGLWRAHKVRNRVVHDSEHELNSMEAKSAIKKYRRALKELNVL